jgi:phosphoribosylamine--glycine ligase
VAAAGYPGEPQRGDRIHGLEDALRHDAVVFHSGTGATHDGGFETNGGRVLSVVATGPDLAAARATAEAAADRIAWTGAQRRHDIGAGAPQPVTSGAAR